MVYKKFNGGHIECELHTHKTIVRFNQKVNTRFQPNSPSTSHPCSWRCRVLAKSTPWKCQKTCLYFRALQSIWCPVAQHYPYECPAQNYKKRYNRGYLSMIENLITGIWYAFYSYKPFFHNHISFSLRSITSRAGVFHREPFCHSISMRHWLLFYSKRVTNRYIGAS